MRFTIISSAVIALLFFATLESAHANTILIQPSDDAALYTCAGCNTLSNGLYLLVSGYIQGAVKFPTNSISGTVTQALLSVNPYALPLFGLNVDVYGFTSNNALISASDANAGSFLGTMILPSNLGGGEDAFFDVTNFVSIANAPYIGFNLRNQPVDMDVFSSIENNYGHPSQLLVTSVPVSEPSAGILLLAGLGVLTCMRSKNKPFN